MDRTQPTAAQAKILHAAVHRTLGYLFRLRARMEKAGFPPGDKLFGLTDSAYDALHSLSVELHYLSCPSGVGRPSGGNRG